MIKRCKNCNKEFETSKYYTQKRFCSNSCRGKWQYSNGNNIPPLQIGSIPWNKGLTKVTDNRLQEMAKNRTGSKNWMWKGGVTQRFRDIHKRKLNQWRKLVFERDSYTCQECGQKGGCLHPHHKIQISQNNKLAFDVNNGITLCQECHRNKHKK